MAHRRSGRPADSIYDEGSVGNEQPDAYRPDFADMQAEEVAGEWDTFERQAQAFPGMTADRLRELYSYSPDAYYKLMEGKVQTARANEDDDSGRVPVEVYRSAHRVPALASSPEKEWYQEYIGPSDIAHWTAMFPPLGEPDRHGNRYQPPAVRVQKQYKEHKRREGWTEYPKADFAPPGWLQCELPGADGGLCPKKTGGDEDEAAWQLELHQASKHANTWQARRLTKERASMEKLADVLDRLGKRNSDPELTAALRAIAEKMERP